MKDAAMPSYMIVIVGAGLLAFAAGCVLIWITRPHNGFGGDGGGGVDGGGCDGGGGGY